MKMNGLFKREDGCSTSRVGRFLPLCMGLNVRAFMQDGWVGSERGLRRCHFTGN
jgi:hypothetical protein